MANAARNEVEWAASPVAPHPGNGSSSAGAAARALLFLVRREEAVSRPVAKAWWVALRDLAW